MPRALAVLVLVLASCLTAAAQVRVEGEMFVADRGTNGNGSDGAVRRYNHVGQLIATLPASGSGAVRSLELDAAGNLYVARGNQVLRYQAPGYLPDAGAFASGTKAQCIAVHPTTQELWIGWGAQPSEAMIERRSPTGASLGVVLSGLLDHPRSMVFSEDGDRLFVANSTGNDVLVVNVAVTPPTVAVHSALGSFGTAGFQPIGIARDPAFGSDDLYVTGDTSNANDVLRVTGLTGATVTSSAVNYASNMAMNAPAGCYVDSWGNLYLANRDPMGSVPGVYRFRLDGQVNTVPPMTGAPLINPIDVAFRMIDFDLTVVNAPSSSDVFDVGGVASVTVGPAVQPKIRIDIDVPAFPNRAYVVFFSLLTGGECASGDPVRAYGEGLPFHPLDPRRITLESDGLFQAGFQMLAQEISGAGGQPFAIDTAFCPSSTAGSSLFLYGVLDGSGHGQARLTFPTFPAACFPAGFDFSMGFSAAVLDTSTGPYGFGAVSGAPECLRVFHFP